MDICTHCCLMLLTSPKIHCTLHLLCLRHWEQKGTGMMTLIEWFHHWSRQLSKVTLCTHMILSDSKAVQMPELVEYTSPQVFQILSSNHCAHHANTDLQVFWFSDCEICSSHVYLQRRLWQLSCDLIGG
jgi:hypothetical protein